MRVICEREYLTSAFCFCSRIAKNEIFPLSHAVLLTATAGKGQEHGTLTLIGRGMLHAVGLHMQLSVTVEEEGYTLVPIEPLAEYLSTLRSGSITLTQEGAANALAVVPVQDQMAFARAVPENGAPLVIESVYTSDAGTISTHQARLQTWLPTQYPLPPIQAWRSAPQVTCILQAALLKKALAACVSFACEGVARKGNAAEMYGVHLCLETQALVLSATTGTMLISHPLPLDLPTPFAFAGLFEGKALLSLKDVLPKDGLITVTLAREVQTQKLVLLLSTTNVTWFCRSMDGSWPAHWEDLLRIPHEAECLIRRRELREALHFFAKVANVSECIALEAKGMVLSMRTLPNEVLHAEQTLHLVSASADFTVLVNPKQFKRLVGLVSGELLRLEVCRVVRQNPQEKHVMGFLRAASEHRQVMMSLSREERREAPSYPSHEPQESGSAHLHAEPVMTS